MNKSGKLFEEAEKLVKEIKEKCAEASSHSLSFCKKDLVDEAIEARMAVDKQDWQELKEELGDVLWSWIDFCIVAEKEGLFTIEEVLEFLKYKLVQRNPHVFGNEKANSAQEAREAKKKAKEKWKKRKSR